MQTGNLKFSIILIKT